MSNLAKRLEALESKVHDDWTILMPLHRALLAADNGAGTPEAVRALRHERDRVVRIIGESDPNKVRDPIGFYLTFVAGALNEHVHVDLRQVDAPWCPQHE